MVKKGVILDTNIAIGLLNDHVTIVQTMIVASAIHKKYELYTLVKGMWFAEQYGIKMIKNKESAEEE
ncbi:hypothetical protein [Paenibacillus eucommiae]|uniref:PIN domain-containing protein n=1 Tax=Paenibacillus eucommiae TaxID=1355755 RepID=A0ABS4J9L9_9BACL|nr:hypothetical protein [Paenibacillus eucommiae]MBP1996545.1 hypothetical protein [Paenibacillus eucommiae]